MEIQTAGDWDLYTNTYMYQATLAHAVNSLPEHRRDTAKAVQCSSTIERKLQHATYLLLVLKGHFPYKAAVRRNYGRLSALCSRQCLLERLHRRLISRSGPRLQLVLLKRLGSTLRRPRS